MVWRGGAMSLLVALALVGLLAGPAAATPITLYGANSSGNLSANVTFDVSGGYLQATLTNTSSADVLVPADVLTAVFFTIPGVTLTPSSATLAGGSTIIYGSQPAGGNVGGEWAYAGGLSGAPFGATSGISSSGFGLFGLASFTGPNLSSPPPNGAVGGVDYGLVSAGDTTGTGNTGVTGNPLIHNSVVFLLSGIPAGFDPSTAGIINVSFQYGTSLSEPNVPVSEPATMLLFGTGLIGLAGIGRRRFRK